jgi:hypothetical protein
VIKWYHSKLWVLIKYLAKQTKYIFLKPEQKCFNDYINKYAETNYKKNLQSFIFKSINNMQLQSFLQQYAAHPFYKAPRGNTLNAKSWQTEAPLRMLLNNLDAEVAENPAELSCIWRHRTSSTKY